MKKQFQKFGLALVLMTVGLSSCVNLKHVNEFYSLSLKSIKIFEEINYTFKQNCLDNCQDNKINDIRLSAKDCDCKLNEKADSVTLLIYNSVQGYLEGLTNLSNNDLTSYKMDALAKELTEVDFGSIKIEKEQVEAYSKISNVLLRAFTDEYRKKKIKNYVKDANESIKVLIAFLDFNLSSNLVGNLRVQKESIEGYSFELLKDSSLSTIEKRKILEECSNRINLIELKEKEILTYSKSLHKIIEGHQKLTDNIDKLSQYEIKKAITQYLSDIQDIVSEFNKLKK